MKRLFAVCALLACGAVVSLAQPIQRNFVTTNTLTTIGFSDTGANTLWGWDDTDNRAVPFTIGANLTYTHATHTLSGAAGGSASTFSTNFVSTAGGTNFANAVTFPGTVVGLDMAGDINLRGTNRVWGFLSMTGAQIDFTNATAVTGTISAAGLSFGDAGGSVSAGVEGGGTVMNIKVADANDTPYISVTNTASGSHTMITPLSISTPTLNVTTLNATNTIFAGLIDANNQTITNAAKMYATQFVATATGTSNSPAFGYGSGATAYGMNFDNDTLKLSARGTNAIIITNAVGTSRVGIGGEPNSTRTLTVVGSLTAGGVHSSDYLESSSTIPVIIFTDSTAGDDDWNIRVNSDNINITNANNTAIKLIGDTASATWQITGNASLTGVLGLTARSDAPPNIITNGANIWTTGTNLSVNLQQPGTGLIMTNNIAFASYGNLAMGTGTVTHTAAQLLFTNYNYSIAGGNVGAVTNTLIVTNAGDYKISFGSFIGGINSDVMTLAVLTNGVTCSIVRLQHTATANVLSETGFKEFIVNLPAMCVVGLGATNANSATMTLQNTTLNVQIAGR